MMRVAHLVDALRGLPPDAIVVLAKDGEGNGYSPLSGVSTGSYYVESDVSGEFYDRDNGYTPDDVVAAVCLWPTN